MNFLNFLTAGASLFNFNLQNLNTSSLPKNETNPNELEVDPQAQLEALTHQQQLINQYMHLNLQLLNQKLQTLEKVPEAAHKDSLSREEAPRNPTKKTKKINKCGHEDKQHYAKGMCNNCYHRFGRNKRPWNCSHSKLYAAGMCQNCYINNYNRKKRQGRGKDDTEPKIQMQSEFDEEKSYIRDISQNSKKIDGVDGQLEKEEGVEGEKKGKEFIEEGEGEDCVKKLRQNKKEE